MRAARATVAAIACAAVAGRGSKKEPPQPDSVGAAVTADPPTGPARATMIMAYAGGWAGHDARAQQRLMRMPGALLLRHGWRVVSIDYGDGAPVLDDVLDAVGSEIERRTSNGPLCISGESTVRQLAWDPATLAPKIGAAADRAGRAAPRWFTSRLGGSL